MLRGMIKLLKILGTAIIVITIVAVYFLFFRKSNNQVLSKIPRNTTSIMVIDVRSLSKKLLMDDLGKGLKNSAKKFASLLPDSIANIDWTNNGLGLPDKLALFTLEDTSDVKLHILIPLSNAKKFSRFVKLLGSQMKFTIQESDGIQWAFAKNPGILLAWDNKFACGVYTSHYTNDNLNSLRGILTSSEEQSIMGDTCFVRQLASAFDVMVFSRSYRKCPARELEILNDNIELGVSFIRFNAGEAMIHTVVKPKNQSALSKLFVQASNSMPILANYPHTPIYFQLQVNPTIFRQLYNQYRPIDVTTHLSGYPDVWDGRLSLTLNGMKTVENKYTAYEYDDNFNKIAITKLKNDTILDTQVVAGILSDRLQNIHPLVNGKDTVLFTGGNVVLRKEGQFFAVYNKSCTRPRFSEASSPDQVQVSVAYPELSAILKRMGLGFKTAYLDSVGVSKILVTARQLQTIQIACSLSFLDAKRNSFYTLVEKIPNKGF